MVKNPKNLFLRGKAWYYNFYVSGQRFQGRIRLHVGQIHL